MSDAVITAAMAGSPKLTKHGSDYQLTVSGGREMSLLAVANDCGGLCSHSNISLLATRILFMVFFVKISMHNL